MKKSSNAADYARLTGQDRHKVLLAENQATAIQIFVASLKMRNNYLKKSFITRWTYSIELDERKIMKIIFKYFPVIPTASTQSP